MHKPRYAEIYDCIMNDFRNGKYELNQKLPTDKALCETYSVSLITIKKTMNILVEEGYIKRTSGKGTFLIKLPNESLPKLSFIANSYSDAYGEEICRLFELYCIDNGYIPLINRSFGSIELENQLILRHINEGTKGIIIIPVNEEYFNPTILKLSFEKFPIVVLDREITNVAISFVTNDHISSTKLLYDYINKKRYHKVLTITPYCYTTSSIKDRVNTMSLCTENGGQINEILYYNSFLTEYKDMYTNSNILILKNELLSYKEKRYDVIFCIQYEIAVAAYKACKDIDYNPEIICFDYPKSTTHISFTHIRQDENEIFSRTITKLEDSLNGIHNVTKDYIIGTLITREHKR